MAQPPAPWSQYYVAVPGFVWHDKRVVATQAHMFPLTKEGGQWVSCHALAVGERALSAPGAASRPERTCHAAPAIGGVTLKWMHVTCSP